MEGQPPPFHQAAALVTSIKVTTHGGMVWVKLMQDDPEFPGTGTVLFHAALSEDMLPGLIEQLSELRDESD